MKNGRLSAYINNCNNYNCLKIIIGFEFKNTGEKYLSCNPWFLLFHFSNFCIFYLHYTNMELILRLLKKYATIIAINYYKEPLTLSYE